MLSGTQVQLDMCNLCTVENFILTRLVTGKNLGSSLETDRSSGPGTIGR